MRFDYYTSFALALATTFVNSDSPLGDRLGSAKATAGFLRELSDLSFLADFRPAADIDLDEVQQLYHDALASWVIGDGELAQLRTFRDQIRMVFAGASADPEAAAAELNALLAEHRAVPRISLRQTGPHLHFEAATDGVVPWLATTITMGVAIFVCDGQHQRLGICASASCRNVFVDQSKNGRKTYCSEVCAHRESVAAYRARKRTKTV